MKPRMNTEGHGRFPTGRSSCRWKHAIFIGVRLCSSVVAFLLVVSQALAHGPDLLEGVGFDQRPGAQLPREAAFVDEGGRHLTLGQALDGKPSVLVLGYLGCRDLCPTTLAGVTRALDASGLAPGRDYRGLFVSIDPRETAADLARAKRERIAAADRGAWTFLRGDGAAIAALAKAAGFRYRYEPERDAFAHAAGFAVLTPRGEISRDFLGMAYDPASLGSALRAAGGGAVARPASPLLLLCYHFDPLTGRYTLAILDMLRGVIALFLGAAAFCFWRRHRKPRAEPQP